MLRKRNENSKKRSLLKEMDKYSRFFLFNFSKDTVLFEYKRKMKKEIQWHMLTHQGTPLLFSFLLFKLV
jgi:hypothetical protein